MTTRWKRWFWVFWSGSLLLRLALGLLLDLTPDEAYYWEFARRPALSYFDHPPMVGYLIAVFRFVLGDIVAAVRLPAILSFSALLWILFIVGEKLTGDARVGFLSALLLQIHPAGTALGFIMTPDVPLSLAWGLGILAFLHVIDRGGIFWWALLGACLGFGALGKYNMIFFCPGVAVVLLAWKDLRPTLATKGFWCMFGLAFLGAVPVLLWNHQHDWISFKFQLHHGFRPSDRGVLSSLGEFFGGQLGTLGPFLYPVIWYVTILWLIKGWRDNDRPRFALAILAIPTMLFFLKRGFTSKVEANWPQIAYLSVMPLVAEWLLEPGSPRRRWVVCLPSLLLMLLAVFQAFTLFLPLPGRSDVSMRLHGWETLGEAVQRFDEKTGKRVTFLGQGVPFTALVSFYGRLPPDRIGSLRGQGNWMFWWQDSMLPVGADLVYVDEGRYSEIAGVARYFTETIASESIPVTFAGRDLRTINISYLKGYKGGLQFK